MTDIRQMAEEAADELHTMADMIRWSVSRMNEAGIYFGHGTDNPWDEALLLVTHALSLPWNIPENWYATAVTRSERLSVLELVLTRIEQRVPAPYLLGVAWFCGQPYVVDERVLIPRSPIGQMIEQRFAPWWHGKMAAGNPAPERILDLCTGSGCIGIACAHTFPDAQVELLDISFEALEVADENIQRHGLSERVMALQSDLFAAASGQYDLIVSNPPYVDAEDMNSLPQEYHHEPELALAAGEDVVRAGRRVRRAADGCRVGRAAAHELDRRERSREDAEHSHSFECSC